MNNQLIVNLFQIQKVGLKSYRIYRTYHYFIKIRKFEKVCKFLTPSNFKITHFLDLNCCLLNPETLAAISLLKILFGMRGERDAYTRFYNLRTFFKKNDSVHCFIIHCSSQMTFNCLGIQNISMVVIFLRPDLIQKKLLTKNLNHSISLRVQLQGRIPFSNN